MQSNPNFKNLEIAEGTIPVRANNWKLWDKVSQRGKKKILAHFWKDSANKSNTIFIMIFKVIFI